MQRAAARSTDAFSNFQFSIQQEARKSTQAVEQKWFQLYADIRNQKSPSNLNTLTIHVYINKYFAVVVSTRAGTSPEIPPQVNICHYLYIITHSPFHQNIANYDFLRYNKFQDASYVS